MVAANGKWPGLVKHLSSAEDPKSQSETDTEGVKPSTSNSYHHHHLHPNSTTESSNEHLIIIWNIKYTEIIESPVATLFFKLFSKNIVFGIRTDIYCCWCLKSLKISLITLKHSQNQSWLSRH